jgi:hypothetical protein
MFSIFFVQLFVFIRFGILCGHPVWILFIILFISDFMWFPMHPCWNFACVQSFVEKCRWSSGWTFVYFPVYFGFHVISHPCWNFACVQSFLCYYICSIFYGILCVHWIWFLFVSLSILDFNVFAIFVAFLHMFNLFCKGDHLVWFLFVVLSILDFMWFPIRVGTLHVFNLLWKNVSGHPVRLLFIILSILDFMWFPIHVGTLYVFNLLCKIIGDHLVWFLFVVLSILDFMWFSIRVGTLHVFNLLWKNVSGHPVWFLFIIMSILDFMWFSIRVGTLHVFNLFCNYLCSLDLVFVCCPVYFGFHVIFHPCCNFTCFQSFVEKCKWSSGLVFIHYPVYFGFHVISHPCWNFTCFQSFVEKCKWSSGLIFYSLSCLFWISCDFPSVLELYMCSIFFVLLNVFIGFDFCLFSLSILDFNAFAIFVGTLHVFNIFCAIICVH